MTQSEVSQLGLLRQRQVLELIPIFSFSMSVVMSMPHRFLHNPNQIQTNTDLTTHQFKQKALQVSEHIKNRNPNEKRFK